MRSTIASFEMALAVLSTHLFITMGARKGELEKAGSGTTGPAFDNFGSQIPQINRNIISLIVVWFVIVMVPPGP